jgi:exo-beta-1,3-glucanase (GH17 family)
MKTLYKILSVGVISFMMINCVNKEETNKQDNMKKISAKDILGNPDYLAISYSGYRENSRDIEPTIDQLKEDMKILAAMGIKLLRTYNVQLEQTANLLKTISQLKVEDPNFEMYVMLGAWIDCENAWTNRVPNHEVESRDNAEEIGRAIVLAKKYPTIVKIIAVGNEAMVKWAESYYVQPGVILKWVNHLQGLKKKEELPIDLWITSSDNFASWGGGESEYHVNDLTNLIKAVDYISLHTYPMHDTHYNPAFWGVPNNEQLSDLEKIEVAMLHAKDYAVSQYQSTLNYMKSLGVNKPIHIGETGWASNSNKEYGDHGSKATDEYKEALYLF